MQIRLYMYSIYVVIVFVITIARMLHHLHPVNPIRSRNHSIEKIVCSVPAMLTQSDILTVYMAQIINGDKF